MLHQAGHLGDQSRPLSRQSTTSVASATTQVLPGEHDAAAATAALGAMQHNHPHHRHPQHPQHNHPQHQHQHHHPQHNAWGAAPPPPLPPPPGYNPVQGDGLLTMLRAGHNNPNVEVPQHMAHPHHPHGYPQDAASLAGYRTMPGQMDHAGSRFTPVHSREASIVDDNMEATMLEEANAATATQGRRGGLPATVINDNELRRLFRENMDKELPEIAQQVMRDEAGPRSEKSKQIFGMVWLKQNIQRAKSSIPRSRVFSAYAAVCGTQRVPILNPASFGKLVRIVFPNVSTRRLGIRGESKYHYIDLALVHDHPQAESAAPSAPASARQSVGPSEPSAAAAATSRFVISNAASDASANRSRLPADTAHFSTTAKSPTRQSFNPSSNLTYTFLHCQQTEPAARFDFGAARVITRPLMFGRASSPTQQGEINLDLPSIEPYLPDGVDMDAVNSLTSVYRSHCTLAIDTFRYCRTEKFCDSYKSLVGLLTVPGQRLLAHHRVAEWVQQCDWLKYQTMLPMLDSIALTQVPARAMEHMEAVAMHLCRWVTVYFQSQPKFLVDAMLGPANIFARLVERFLRVNRAALDASDVLGDVSFRTQFWRDWTLHADPMHIVRGALAFHGHRRLLRILTHDVHRILVPVDSAVTTHDPVFADIDEPSDFDGRQRDPTEVSANVIIQSILDLLNSLPERFPGVDALTLIRHVETVSGNVSRNLTLGGAATLGNWWRVKIFVDEVAHWIAEKGGFLQTGPEAMSQHNRGNAAPRASALSQQNSSSGAGPSGSGRKGPRPPSNSGVTQRPTPPQSAGSAGSAHAHPSPKGSRRSNSGSQTNSSNPPPLVSGSDSHSASTEPANVEGAADDSGIGLGMDDDFTMDTKFNAFVEGEHGSDPADVVVC